MADRFAGMETRYVAGGTVVSEERLAECSPTANRYASVCDAPPSRKEEKEERLQRLNELINKYALINNKKLINKEENVLVEGFSSKNSDLLMGYTETNKLVNFKGDPSLIGKIVKVKILDAKTWSLDGEYVK